MPLGVATLSFVIRDKKKFIMRVKNPENDDNNNSTNNNTKIDVRDGEDPRFGSNTRFLLFLCVSFKKWQKLHWQNGLVTRHVSLFVRRHRHRVEPGTRLRLLCRHDRPACLSVMNVQGLADFLADTWIKHTNNFASVLVGRIVSPLPDMPGNTMPLSGSVIVADIVLLQSIITGLITNPPKLLNAWSATERLSTVEQHDSNLCVAFRCDVGTRYHLLRLHKMPYLLVGDQDEAYVGPNIPSLKNKLTGSTWVYFHSNERGRSLPPTKARSGRVFGVRHFIDPEIPLVSWCCGKEKQDEGSKIDLQGTQLAAFSVSAIDGNDVVDANKGYPIFFATNNNLSSLMTHAIELYPHESFMYGPFDVRQCRQMAFVEQDRPQTYRVLAGSFKVLPNANSFFAKAVTLSEHWLLYRSSQFPDHQLTNITRDKHCYYSPDKQELVDMARQLGWEDAYLALFLLDRYPFREVFEREGSISHVAFDRVITVRNEPVTMKKIRRDNLLPRSHLWAVFQLERQQDLDVLAKSEVLFKVCSEQSPAWLGVEEEVLVSLLPPSVDLSLVVVAECSYILDVPVVSTSGIMRIGNCFMSHKLTLFSPKPLVVVNNDALLVSPKQLSQFKQSFNDRFGFMVMNHTRLATDNLVLSCNQPLTGKKLLTVTEDVQVTTSIGLKSEHFKLGKDHYVDNHGLFLKDCRNVYCTWDRDTSNYKFLLGEFHLPPSPEPTKKEEQEQKEEQSKKVDDEKINLVVNLKVEGKLETVEVPASNVRSLTYMTKRYGVFFFDQHRRLPQRFRVGKSQGCAYNHHVAVGDDAEQLVKQRLIQCPADMSVEDAWKNMWLGVVERDTNQSSLISRADGLDFYWDQFVTVESPKLCSDKFPHLQQFVQEQAQRNRELPPLLRSDEHLLEDTRVDINYCVFTNKENIAGGFRRWFTARDVYELAIKFCSSPFSRNQNIYMGDVSFFAEAKPEEVQLLWDHDDFQRYIRSDLGRTVLSMMGLLMDPPTNL